MKYIKKLISIVTVMALSIMLVACGSLPNGGSVSSSASQTDSSAGTDSGNGSAGSQDAADANPDGKKKDNASVNGELKVHFIDVGQADSILIQQGSENMLIDAGNNDDEKTLKNYLSNIGVSEFKYVVGTHAHEDHIGSLDYVMNSFKVGKIYFPKATSTTKTFENLAKAVKNKGMQFTVPNVGETFNIGDAKCTVLAPNGTSYDDANNYSIVIKLEYGNNSFLFTGDAEDVSEEEMLAKGFDLRADVLKAGHHGSSSSSTDAFLNAVNPKYAVISVGKDNDYGHPHKETLQKFSSKGINVYRTDESGTIVATSDGNNITFSASPSTSNKAGSAGSSGSKKDSAGSLKADSNSSASADAGSGAGAGVQVSGGSGQAGNTGDTVWISKNGGKVYHKDKTCSGMKNPIEKTLGEAEGEGLGPCSKCA